MRTILSMLLMAAVTLAAAPPPRAPAEQTTVVAVEVPVQVTRAGQAVRGLTAADFALFDGDRPQAITGFEVVDLAATATAAPSTIEPLAVPVVAASGRRYFLFLFDLAFSQPVALAKARRAALDLAAGHLQPTDLVAVASYRRDRGLELLLGFSTDRALLAHALANLGQPQLFDRNPDTLRLSLSVAEAKRLNPPPGTILPSTSGQAGTTRGEVAAMKDAELIAQLTADAQAEARTQRGDLADRVRAFTESWRNLARLLGGIEGRKYVLFLSEGFDSRLLTGAATERRDQEASETGRLWEVDSEARFGTSQTRGHLDRLIEELRRDDCVIYAIDIGGLRAAADAQAVQVLGETVAADAALGGSGLESLVALSHDTGGELIRNFNDLGQAMAEVLDRTAVTYVLAFQPAGLKLDGAYHRLRVEARGVARGARLSHRAGYYAPRPYSDRSAAEHNLESARLLTTGVDQGLLVVDLLAAPLPAEEEGFADVPVLLEIQGEALLAEHWGDDLTTSVFLYAFDGRGAVADYLVQRLDLDLTRIGVALRAGGIRFCGRLRLPPGDFSLRCLLRNERTGSYRLQTARLSVPGFATGRAAVLTPLVPAPGESPWLVARSPRWAASGADFPFRRGGGPFFPSARPRLVAGAAGEVWVPTVGLADSPARLELVDGVDRAVALGPVTAAPPEPAGSIALAVPLRFTVPRLAPGRYRLRAVIDDPAGPPLRSPDVSVELLDSAPPS